jgi:hypothetical protein
MAVHEDLNELARTGWGPDRLAGPMEALDQVVRFEHLSDEQRRLVLNCLRPTATSGDLLAVVAHPSRIKLTEFLILAHAPTPRHVQT